MTHPSLPAEALAWPLLDPAALRRGDTRLCPDALAPGFQARAAHLRGGAEAEAVGALVWDDPSAPLRSWLVAHACQILHPWGAHLRLIPDRANPSAEILRWRWLSLALPPGLLIAAATPPALRPQPWVPILPAALAPDGPIAHLHLHLGAVYPFEILWSNLSNHLDATRLATCSEAPSGFGAQEWPRWLVRGLLARRVLAHRLLGVRRPPSLDAVRLTANEPGALQELSEGRLHAVANSRREAALLRMVLQRAKARQRPNTLDEVWAQDPISDGGPWPEGRLIQAGLHSALAPEDERLFLQMLRIKVVLFRFLVSDPAQPGLSSFVQTYARIAYYDGGLDAAGMDLASFDPVVRLGAVEARIAPTTSPEKLLDRVAPRRGPAEVEPPADHTPEWAYILHFIRWKAGKHAPAGQRGEALRRLFLDHEAKASGLARTLEAWPQLLWVVRGLDVAGDERRGPLWLVVPALKATQRRSTELAAQTRGLQPLRITLHAGEDFAHLLSGVRAVMEPFEWGLLGPGDRLGHALALGEQPDRWFESHKRCVMPRLERLHDLLWALDASARWNLDIAAITLRRWEAEIAQLSTEIWGHRVATEHLGALRRRLGDADFLPSLNLFRTHDPPPPIEQGTPNVRMSDTLMRHLLRSPAVSHKAWSPVQVESGPDQGATALLLQRVREHVARSAVCVELNPSSNLMIGDLSAPLDQPMFQLRPLQPKGDPGAVIPVTLNADDPVCFSTALSDELAYAWAGMVGAGIAPHYATEWMNDAARTAWRYRFTLTRSAALRVQPPGVAGRRWWRPTPER